MRKELVNGNNLLRIYLKVRCFCEQRPATCPIMPRGAVGLHSSSIIPRLCLSWYISLLQALEVRKELVKGNNTLCSQLLDVQVELSQNHPGRMTAEERANAAHRFQAHMRVRMHCHTCFGRLSIAVYLILFSVQPLARLT